MSVPPQPARAPGHRPACGAGLLAIAAALSAQAAHARTEEAAPAMPMATPAAHTAIIVSATRIPTAEEEAPATVSTLDATEIADRFVTDIQDLVRYEPGVSVRRAPARFGAALGTTGRARAEDFTIRGIGGNRVLIQVDGIRMPQGFSFGAQDVGRGGYADLSLIKSVEILRGPASALYGSDGLAGAVSFITRDPADLIAPGRAIGGFASVQYASADEEWAETAALAGRSGALSAMLAYSRRDFSELENRGSVGGTGPTRTLPNPQDGASDAFFGRLAWEGGAHRLRLTGEHLASRVESRILSGEGPAFLFGPTPSWIVDRLTADDRTRRSRLSLDYTFTAQGDGALDHAHVALYWQDASDRQFALEERSPVNATPRPDRERLNTFENRVWGAIAEMRSGFTLGTSAHVLAAGGDLSWTRQEGLRDGTVPPAGETYPSRAFPVTDFTLGGLFLSHQVSFGETGLALYPGLRFDFYELDPQADPLLPTFTPSGQSGSRLSPKLGLTFALAEGLMAYGNYAQGFRAPTPYQVNNFFENLAQGYTSAPNPDLGPERSESWEAGLRLSTGPLRLSLAAFRADYRDFIDQAVVGGSFTPADPAIYQFVNLAKARVEGLEGRAAIRAGNGLFGELAVAWADGDTQGATGTRVPLATVDPLNLVMGAGWRDPAGRAGLELILTHHARKSAADSEGLCTGGCYRPDAFTILDATAFVRLLDALTLRAGLFNLTNQTYAYWTDVRGLAASSTITEAFTRPGRNASVSIAFTF